MELPKRIFLDTSVINLIVEYWEPIFDKTEVTNTVSSRVFNDIQAMAQIFYYADHNAIEMVISKTTFQEITVTADVEKRERLLDFSSGLQKYMHQLIEDDYRIPGVEVAYYEEYLLDKGLNFLNGASDRRLIIEALFYKCDVFCTRDYKTILKHRTKLRKAIPLEILTPLEWYGRYHNRQAY